MSHYIFETHVSTISRLCNGCGYCVDECFLNVLEISKQTGKVRIVKMNTCTACARCINACTEAALYLEADSMQPAT